MSHLIATPFEHKESSPELAKEQFGVIVEGVKDINNLTEDEAAEIQKLLYTHSIVLFRNVDLTPKGEYSMIKMFDPESSEYGHGNVGRPDNKSILHPDLRNVPSHPAVQLIGNGPVTEESVAQGIPIPLQLVHPSHETFHRTPLSAAEREQGLTRFYRWHIDAALYERNPPRATGLHALTLPESAKQTLKYDDGTGDELEVPIGGTSFVSGKIMFDILSPEMKSLAVRTRVRYAPHPYIWMSKAKSNSVGLGMVTEGLEYPLDELPPWEESKVKILPLVWKNPVTGNLHVQVHPSGVQELLIAPVADKSKITSETLYPDGAHLTDLKEVRDLIYSIQRPAIAPKYVYTVDWQLRDFVVFHNRGVLHSITGSFKPTEKRAFWQCNLAASDTPAGPSEEDVAKYI